MVFHNSTLLPLSASKDIRTNIASFIYFGIEFCPNFNLTTARFLKRSM